MMVSKRRVRWDRVAMMGIVILELVVVIGFFFAMKENAKQQLRNVKNEVVQTEGLSSKPDDIYVYRFNGGKYVYFLVDGGDPITMSSDKARRDLDDYIQYQSNMGYILICLGIGIILVDGYIYYKFLI